MEFTEEQIKAAGDIEHDFRDLGGVTTIRAYLVELLRVLWTEGEGFSGKRPFGNSGWEFDLYAALVAGGAITGELDEDGYLVEYDKQAADKLIFEVIDSLDPV